MSLGTRGDVQPFVSLGVELKRRGHAVTVSTGAGFEAMIEAAGLTAAPLTVDYQALLADPAVQAGIHHGLRGKVQAWRTGRGLLRQQYDEQWDIGHAERPNVIVYNPKATIAAHIARDIGAVAIPAVMQPVFAPTADFPFMMLPVKSLGGAGNRLSHRLFNKLVRSMTTRYMGKWAKTRADVDLRDGLDDLAGFAPGGGLPPRLHAYSRHLVPEPADWDAREIITGSWFGDTHDDWQPCGALARFLGDGPPPVYVGFGSMPSEDGERLAREAVAGLRRAGTRGVLATGWGGLKAAEGEADMLVIEGAPHSWLFPRCAAVVHHGGAGTTHEGLRWGRPSVICPVFGDQPFWARRVAEVGAGAEPLPMKRFTADALAERLQVALSETVRARAEDLGEQVRAEAGVAAAADAVEKWVL